MTANILPFLESQAGTSSAEIRRRVGIRSSVFISMAFAAGTVCLLFCYVAIPHGAMPANLNHHLAFGAVALLLFGAAGGTLFARHVGRPIEALATTAARAAGDLRFAEARHESFWKHTPKSLFTVEVTADGRFVFAGINPAHERLTGLRATHIVGKEPRDCLPPEVAKAVMARDGECVRLGKAITYDETLDLPGGVRFWRTSLAPVRDPATGYIALLFGSARDVTRDLQTNAELALLNERLQHERAHFIRQLTG